MQGWEVFSTNYYCGLVITIEEYRDIFSPVNEGLKTLKKWTLTFVLITPSWDPLKILNMVMVVACFKVC